MTLINNSLSAETILLVDHTESAAEVIAQLSEELAAHLGVDRGTIEQAILERESTRTTAFANGAAIPHCRLPGLNTFGIAIMVLTQPVRWDNEGHAVDTIMMIAGPTTKVGEHLRILANSTQLLDSPALRAKLKRAPDPKAARKLLAAAETAIEQRRSQEGMLRELRKDQANSGQVDHLAGVADRFEW